MRNATPQAREAFPCSTIDARKRAASVLERGGDRPSAYWVEPCTGQIYPHAFEAYRRRREAEERPPSRHRGLGPDVEGYIWRRWGARRSPSVEVQLTLRAGTSPRIRCLLTKILDAIRRGRSARDAIRLVSRRFGLRQMQIRSCLAACLRFTTCARGDALSRLAEPPWLS